MGLLEKASRRSAELASQNERLLVSFQKKKFRTDHTVICYLR